MSKHDDEDNIVSFQHRHRGVDLGADFDLPLDTRIKWAMMRVIAIRLEDSGMLASRFTLEVGEDPVLVQHWLNGIDVSIDRLAAHLRWPSRMEPTITGSPIL